jgi:uncharacterized protein
MAEHPNATLARRGLDAFNAGDMAAYADLIADDVVWHQIGDETLRGKEALAATVSQMSAGDSIQAKVHDVVANDDHVIALVEATATRGGRSFTYRTAEIMHVRDGKVTERWAFSDDTEAIKEFFA